MLSLINFARILTDKRKKQQKKDRKLLFLVALAVIVLLVISLSIFGVRFYFQKQVAATKKEQTRLASQWETFKTEELAYTIYAQKVKILAALFSSRQEKQAALKKFRSLFDEGATVVGLKYAAESQEIIFQIRSDSVFVLQQVVEKLDSIEIKENFGTVYKERTTRNDKGQYVLSVRVSLDALKKE